MFSPKTRFRLEKLSGTNGTAGIDRWVYAGGRSWNVYPGFSGSREYTDRTIYFYTPTNPTGSRYTLAVQVPPAAGAYDYGSCGPAWPTTASQVFYFGGKTGIGVPEGTASHAMWMFEASAGGGGQAVSIHSTMNKARVNPHAIAFQFPWTSGSATVNLTGSWMVFGDDGVESTSSEFFVSNPFVSASTSGAFNRWISVTGALAFSHVKGAAVAYPSGNSVLLFGGSGSTGVERMALSGLIIPLPGGFQTISFGSVAITGANQQMSVNRHSFAHGIDQLGRLWVVGGKRTSDDAFLSSTEIFDFTTETWSAGPSLPYAIANGKLVINRFSGSDEILIIGGHSGTSMISQMLSARVMNTGSGWGASAYVPYVSRGRGHQVDQVNASKMIVVGGEHLVSGSWTVHPFGVEEVSTKSAPNPFFASSATGSFVYRQNPYSSNLDFMEVVSDTPNTNWLPLLTATFSRVSTSVSQGNPFDVLNDAGGVLNPVTGVSDFATSEDLARILPYISPTSSLYSNHALSVGFPLHFVMNGCVVTLTTPSATISKTLDYLGPVFSGTQLPSNAATGTGSITWNGWWLNKALSARYTNTSIYGNGIGFAGGISSNGDFATVFTIPNLTTPAYDGLGNPIYLRQNTLHDITVNYDTLTGSTAFGRATTWTSPNLGPQAHFQDANVSIRYVLNNTSSFAVEDGAGNPWGAATFDTMTYITRELSSSWVSGTAWVFPNNTSTLGSLKWGTGSYGPWLGPYLALNQNQSTIEFWYRATAGTDWNPPSVSWAVGAPLPPTVGPTLFSWDMKDVAHTYSVDTGNFNENVSNLKQMKLSIGAQMIGTFFPGLYTVTTLGLKLEWEIGHRYNAGGTLFGPTQVYCQTSFIPPRDGQVHHVVVQRNLSLGSTPSSVSIYLDTVYMGTWYPTIQIQFTGYDDNQPGVVMNFFAPGRNGCDPTGLIVRGGHVEIYSTGSTPANWANYFVGFSEYSGMAGQFYFGNFNATVGQIVISQGLRSANDIARAYQQGKGIIF